MPQYTTGTSRREEPDDDRILPPVTLDYLAHGVSEHRNDALMSAGEQCRDARYAKEEMFDQLLSRAMADGLSEKEATKTINSAYSRPSRDPIRSGRNGAFATNSAPPSRAASSPPKPSSVPPRPEPLPAPMAEGAKFFVEHLFRPDERVSVSEAIHNSKGDLAPDGGQTKPVKNFLEQLKTKSIEEIYRCKDGVYIRINPMKMRGKKDPEVTDYRHFLVEFDRDKKGRPIPKEIQFAIFRACPFPIAAITASGNISLHALIRIDAEQDRNLYDGRAREVIEYFSQFAGYDPSTKNPSRYSRLPGVPRNLYENGKLIGIGRQELLTLSLGPVSWEEYEKAQTPTDEDLQRLTKETQSYYAQIEQPMPPPMAKAAYIGKAGQIVDIITRAGTEACPESLLVQFLVAFGNIVGRRPYRKQAAVHHLNEFTVLVGESGIGCKGTAWNAIYDLLSLIDAAWLNNRVQDGFQSGESIVDKLRDPSTRLTRGGRRVTDPGESDKRLLIMEEEFGRILIVANRQGNTLSAVLRNAWDAKGVLWTSSKNDPQKATGAHLSLIGHVTPKELRKNLSEIDSTNGFANRILWIPVKGVGEVAIPSPVDWKRNHPDLVRSLVEIVKNFQNRPASQMEWSAEANGTWKDYYRDLKKRRFGGLLGPIVKRSIAHVLRLTMIYAILDNSNLLMPQHLQAAIAVVEYSERGASWCFGQRTGDKDADKILWELERAPTGITKSEIFKIFGRNRSATDINMSLAVLQDNGLALPRTKRSETGTKALERWFSVRHLSDS